MKLSELNRIMRAHERTLNKLKKDSDGQLDLIRSQQWTIDHLNDEVAKIDLLKGQNTRLRNRLNEGTTELKYEQLSLAMACRHVCGLSKSGIGFKCVATDGPCPNKSQCPTHYAKFFRKQAKDV